MKKLNLMQEIKAGQKEAKKTKELYQLLSSYNAYNILLLKAKSEYERKSANINEYYLYSNCYKEQIVDLFSLFKNDECLKVMHLSKIGSMDMLFLIDQNTLLRMNSFDIMNSNIVGLSRIDYELLKINNCICKVYNQNIYCGDPYYCDTHSEDKEAFGLFYNKELLTPSYSLDNQFKAYDNLDIRKILKPQSFNDIHEKITESKNTKTKKLVLTK